MTTGPDLAEGETLLHHHKPHLGAFKRTALLLLVITLVPTAVMYFAFPDTLWVAVPLFVTCLLLMQERFTLGKHAAWITDKRVVMQFGKGIALSDIGKIDTIGNAVRVRPEKRGPSTKLYYAKDKAALMSILKTAQKGISS